MLKHEWEREIEDSLDIRISSVPWRLLGEYRANKRIIERGERSTRSSRLGDRVKIGGQKKDGWKRKGSRHFELYWMSYRSVWACRFAISIWTSTDPHGVEKRFRRLFLFGIRVYILPWWNTLRLSTRTQHLLQENCNLLLTRFHGAELFLVNCLSQPIHDFKSIRILNTCMPTPRLFLRV
jgi:hypothetical protein